MMDRRLILFYHWALPGFALLLASCKPVSQNQETAKASTETSAKELPEAKAATPIDSLEPTEDHEHQHDHAEEGLELTPEETAALAPASDRVVQREFVPTASLTGQIYRGAGEESLRRSREKEGSAYASCLLSSQAAQAVAQNTKAQFNRPPPSTVQYQGSLFRKEDEESGWQAGQRELLWEIKDPGLTLQVGDMVTGSVPLDSQPRLALAVPNEAVLTTAMGPVVYTHHANLWRRRVVKIGVQDDGWTEILEGLQENDEVAVHSVDILYLLERKKESGGGHGH